MKFIQTSTLIHNTEHDLLVRAFGERGLEDLLEKRFEILLLDLANEAEKKLLASIGYVSTNEQDDVSA